MHDRGVSVTCSASICRTSCPNGLSTACPSAMVLSCSSVKLPPTRPGRGQRLPPAGMPATSGPRGRGTHPNPPAATTPPQSVESRACQAGCTTPISCRQRLRRGPLQALPPLLQRPPHALLDGRRSLTVGARHWGMQRRNALDLCPTVQRRYVAESHQPSGSAAKASASKSGNSRHSHSPTHCPDSAHLCIGKARIEVVGTVRIRPTELPDRSSSPS